ncbi:MAG TPA: UrcA family protein [Gammaproteobacteria bacterium]|nr:UrcA family protein [Gammaproteobacteria bacterium]
MKTLHTSSRLVTTLIVVAGVFSILAPAARAAAPVDARSVAVSYAQLDLADPAAVETLFRQLTVAAERACGAYESRSLRERMGWRECRDAAFKAAVAELVEARIAAAQENLAVAPIVASR